MRCQHPFFPTFLPHSVAFSAGGLVQIGKCTCHVTTQVTDPTIRNTAADSKSYDTLNFKNIYWLDALALLSTKDLRRQALTKRPSQLFLQTHGGAAPLVLLSQLQPLLQLQLWAMLLGDSVHLLA